MLSGSRNFLWLVPLLLLIASPLWKPVVVRFLSPHGHQSTEKMSGQADARFTMTGVRLVRSENGRKEMVLNTALVDSGSGNMENFYFTGVTIELFDKGERGAHIIGGEGHYDARKQIMTLVDNVTVYAADKYELHADVLRYLMSYKTLKTAADVFFKTEGVVVQGGSMSYNLETGRYRVGGRVVCDLQ